MIPLWPRRVVPDESVAEARRRLGASRRVRLGLFRWTMVGDSIDHPFLVLETAGRRLGGRGGLTREGTR